MQSLNVASVVGDVDTGYTEDQQAFMVVYQRGVAIWQSFSEVVRACSLPVMRTIGLGGAH